MQPDGRVNENDASSAPAFHSGLSTISATEQMIIVEAATAASRQSAAGQEIHRNHSSDTAMVGSWVSQMGAVWDCLAAAGDKVELSGSGSTAAVTAAAISAAAAEASAAAGAADQPTTAAAAAATSPAGGSAPAVDIDAAGNGDDQLMTATEKDAGDSEQVADDILL